MQKLVHFIADLGWEGITLLVCGFAATTIGVLDFAQIITLDTETALKLIIVASGILMGAIVAYATKTSAEVRSLGGKMSSINTVLFPQEGTWRVHVNNQVLKAQESVFDTFLYFQSHASIPKLTNKQGNLVYEALFERLYRNEITYKCVRIIKDQNSLRATIRLLTTLEGRHCYIRYYFSPPLDIPILNLMIIDEKICYLGGAEGVETASKLTTNAFIDDRKILQLLNHYWQKLWISSRPLNSNRVIDWNEVKTIAKQLGLSDEDYETIRNDCINWSREQIKILSKSNA